MENINSTMEELQSEIATLKADNESLKVLHEKDVAEHKQAEDALLDNESFLFGLFENLPSGTAIYSILNAGEFESDFIAKFFNKAGLRIANKDVSQIIGKSLVDISSELTSPEIVQMFKRVWISGRPEYFSTKVKSVNNTDVYYDYTIFKLPTGEIVAIFTDVTERKLSEEKLSEKDIQFRKLSANVPDMLYQFTRRTNGTYYVPIASEGIVNIFGCSPEDVSDNFDAIGRVIHPDDAERVIREIEYSAENLTYFTCEFRVVIQGRPIQWIYSRSNPEKLPDDSVTWYGFNTNITELKIAGEKINKSEIILKSTIESLKDTIILSIDTDYNYLNFNTFHKNVMLSTYNVEVEVGMNLLVCISNDEDRIKSKKNYDISLQGKSHTTIEEFGDLVRYYYETKYNPILDENGSIIGATAFSANITERIMSEISLRESEDKFRMLFQNLTAGFALHEIILDSENKPCDYRFLEMNPAFERLTGLNAVNIIDKTVLEVMPNTEMFWIETYGKIAVGGEGITFENYSGVLDKYYQVTAYSPKYGKFATIFLDITELKKAEIMLQKQNQELEAQYEEYMQLNEVLRLTNCELEVAKDKAEESDKLKTAFLQNMSHEIRTPLNGILGFSKLLKTEGISHEDINSFTDVIQQSGKRLLEIVNNVLDISIIETGQIKIEKRLFSINSIITDLYSFFAPIAVNKELVFTYHNQLDDIYSLINQDDSKINQILSNLLDNAFKFTFSGSIEYGYEIHGQNILFYIKDTGIGISVDHQQRIFERFTQIDLTITRGFEGAGLGLAICKGLVELLGGKIWVESQVDIGTSFFFTIPYQPVASNESGIKETMLEDASQNGKTILIAEDDRNSFLYLQTALKHSNFEILHAKNGLEAVNFVKNNPAVDIVLMDIRMPLMDGLEATKQIKQIRPDLPIIAQTAYAFTQEKKQILSAGCNEYLSKPIEIEFLRKLLSKYL